MSNSTATASHPGSKRNPAWPSARMRGHVPGARGDARALRAKILSKLIEYLQEQGGVTFVTLAEAMLTRR